MIEIRGNLFTLSTFNTTYQFCISDEGLLTHLYYGAKVPAPRDEAQAEAIAKSLSHKYCHDYGTAVNYNKESSLTLEDLPMEISSVGKGDFREAGIIVVYPDGSRTSDFIFDSYVLAEKPLYLENAGGLEHRTTEETEAGSRESESFGLPLPTWNENDRVSQLTVHLKERFKDVRLDLIYTVFENSDVISRRAVLVNEGEENLRIKRIMSLQLDIDDGEYKMTSFGGNWTREMEKHESILTHGVKVNHTTTGASSNRNNPFVMISDVSATETAGKVFGFNLIYSGNHYEACEVNSFKSLRFVSGIDPTDFEWKLDKGGSFATPEAIMSFSDNGFRGLSLNMHDFVRKHIVRGKFKDEPRPILLNSWEAAYFNISEMRLMSLARKAADAGIELFVMDDGWFKDRNSDKSSLGDWVCDTKKLPKGVKHLSDKVHGLNMKFGIWVEPEMISEDSDLYRAHPEYAMTIPGRDTSFGRNQMVIDLTNSEVVDYLYDALSKVFGENGIDYVKWDMNRLFSDVYSTALPIDRQGEVAHRYMLGLYELLERLTKAFPDILFEGCASGGNRFDLGMLCYFPQIWGSDDTDAIQRTEIQTGYSYGYPLSTVSAHVSDCPNHQTLRNTPMNTRFNIASFGLLGYELNLCDISSDDFDAVKSQVQLYKDWREVFFFGDFYRINDKEWMVVSKDKKKAVAVIWNELNRPSVFYKKLFAAGLDESALYHVYNIPFKHNLKDFGDLVNMVAPIHVKQDSLVHNVLAKFVKMNGETEDYTLSGGHLNNAGLVLAQAFGGAGYAENTRMFQDFASRMYFFEVS